MGTVDANGFRLFVAKHGDASRYSDDDLSLALLAATARKYRRDEPVRYVRDKPAVQVVVAVPSSGDLETKETKSGEDRSSPQDVANTATSQEPVAEAETNDDGVAFGDLAYDYAAHWNDFAEAGIEVPNAETRAADEELDGTGWTVNWDGKRWVAHADDALGGVSIRGRFLYANPVERYDAEESKWGPEQKGPRGGTFWVHKDSGKKTWRNPHGARRKSDRAAKKVDRGALRKRLEPHASTGGDYVKAKAKRGYAALKRHHGPAVVARLEEVADGLEKQLAALPPGQEVFRRAVGERLGAVNHMLGLAEKDFPEEAKEAEITAKVHNPKAGLESGVSSVKNAGLEDHVKGGKPLTAEQVEKISELVHDEWMAREKARPDGVRPDRQHLMVPYAELSEEEKAKDRKFALDGVASMRPDGHFGSKAQPYYRPGANPTVDNVITRTGANGEKEVLMIQRKEGTTEGGKWALPGGFHDSDSRKGEPWREGKETAEEAAIRELAEETGLDAAELRASLKPVGRYEGGGRDPRDNPEAWSASTAFALDLPPELASRAVAGTDDASDAKWVPVSDIKPETLAFDHGKILADAGVTGGGNESGDAVPVQESTRTTIEVMTKPSKHFADMTTDEASARIVELQKALGDREVMDALRDPVGAYMPILGKHDAPSEERVEKHKRAVEAVAKAKQEVADLKTRIEHVQRQEQKDKEQVKRKESLHTMTQEDAIRSGGDKTKRGQAAYANEHRTAVESAVATGKPVPPEVLADYPDIAAKIDKPDTRGTLPPEAGKQPGKEGYMPATSKPAADMSTSAPIPPAPKAEAKPTAPGLSGKAKAKPSRAIDPMAGHPFAGKSREETVANLHRRYADHEVKHKLINEQMGARRKMEVPNESAIADTIQQHVGDVLAKNSFARANLKDVYDTVSAAHPGLTIEQVNAVLQRMAESRRIRMTEWTQPIGTHPHPEYLMGVDGGFKYYVEPGSNPMPPAPKQIDNP